ncbi:MAG TPA: radical SAM protein [Gemmatimonadota bacterium]|nr:radical SAM protein [Gemmatimonadota bacterium]
MTVPHVVAWNITRRCNLACAHCYISAGSWHSAAGELPTDECLRIVDEILAANPSPMLILSGGEPLVRDDLETIAARASGGGATVVVGTNGTGLSDERIASLKAAGVQGVAISIDSLNPVYHDRFRHGTGALSDTLAAVDRLNAAELDFIVQTTVTRGNRDELPALAAWSAERGAVSFNVYFLVETGRGEAMRGMTPEENDAVLAELLLLEAKYRGRMMVRSKCQPQIMRHAWEASSDSPLLKYETRCPCGVHYCRITPEGKVTPCPYMPAVAGDLREASFGEIWENAELFQRLRAPERELGGKCGDCEYGIVCGGCRARAYADSGDPLGADESCAYEPDGSRELIRPAGPSVTYGAADHEPELAWTPEAEARMRRVPSFVRAVVVDRVETWARENGHDEVTADMLSEMRSRMPVDFSRRRPFFLGGKR